MTASRRTKPSNPFRKSPVFVCGEPQDEALARIEYLGQHGAGWCLIGGPKGIGKSALLTELACRAARRGEFHARLDSGPHEAGWWSLLAEGWGLEVTSPMEIRQRLEEHLVGLAIMNRPAWLLIDQAEPITPELVRGCRWLISRAAERRLTLLVIAAGEGDPELGAQADLCLELWPWDVNDTHQYIRQCLEPQKSPGFSDDAVVVLHDRSGGIPGTLARLCEWSWLAAQAESARLVEADIVQAVADELLPCERKPAAYEMSAAYGGW